MNTYIIRENRKIKNKKITIDIPDSFAFDEVEVIILPIAARKQKTKKNSTNQSLLGLQGKIHWEGDLNKMRQSRV
jgi:hypothetical protein